MIPICLEVETLDPIVELDISTAVIVGGGETPPIYDGTYTVTPKAYNAQILDTSGKLMENDVTVYKIPYNEVSNPTGGKTVTIGAM